MGEGGNEGKATRRRGEGEKGLGGGKRLVGQGGPALIG